MMWLYYCSFNQTQIMDIYRRRDMWSEYLLYYSSFVYYLSELLKHKAQGCSFLRPLLTFWNFLFTCIFLPVLVGPVLLILNFVLNRFPFHPEGGNTSPLSLLYRPRHCGAWRVWEICLCSVILPRLLLFQDYHLWGLSPPHTLSTSCICEMPPHYCPLSQNSDLPELANKNSGHPVKFEF